MKENQYVNKIKKFIRRLCNIVGGLVLISLILFISVGLYNRGRVYVPENSVLVIDLSANIKELPQENLLDELNDKPQIKLRNFIQAIEFAAHDPNISALVARIDVSDLEIAQIQDVARAVMHFRANNKKTFAFSQGFGPLGQGNREYYLASFFDKIYMQPHTTIGLTGISVEIPFMRSVLHKIGITPEFYSRYEYKTAMQIWTDWQISPEYKQEMTRLTNALWSELKTDIMHNRNISESELDNILTKAPLSSEQGLSFKLIDGLRYLPELEQQLKDEGITEFVNIEDYMQGIHPNTDKGLPTIAVLTLNGLIDSGESSDGNIDGETSIGSKTVWQDISEIAELPNLKAVIIRIDSPGGSYNAADEIYYALQNLKQTKKVPVIVSQSGYAASGGYFISLAGDYIIAEPTTITGSIGVLGGKFVLNGLWNKLGVYWSTIKNAPNADILSMNQPFTPDERKIFNASLDEIYTDFTKKVTENRQLKKNIDEIARGRVWTGAEALELGLVDALGGMDEALDMARKRGNIASNQKFKVVNYPQPKSLSEKISDLLFKNMIMIPDWIIKSGVNIRYLKLFKRLQYDTVIPMFDLKI